MKQLVRYFSIGLFTAGIIMLIGLFVFDHQQSQELVIDEIIPHLENEGYHVLTNSEYISMSINSDDSNDETDESKQTDSSNEKENPDKSESKDDKGSSNEKTYVVNIKSGMPTSAISSLLEENKIITDASDFTKYLDKHDYSLKVQIGEFEVSSEMSYFELAEAITR